MDCVKILKERFIPLFKKWMLSINDYSNDYYIDIIELDIKESILNSNQYSDYINAGATKDACIMITYSVKNKSNNEIIHNDLVAEYYIPTTLHNLFIIDGKVRAPLNYLHNVSDCCRYGNKLVVTPELTLDFDTNQINYVTDDYYTRNVIGFDELSKLSNDYTDLPPDIAKRLFVQYDLDTIPKTLTTDLIQKLRVPLNNHRDHITKKKVISVYDALYIHLTSKENAKSIISITRNRFYRLQKYYTTAINTSIKQFFKGQSDYLVGLQTESNVNPTTHETLANKVILEKYGQGATGPISQTDYNESLALLLDPAATPDSMNINRINELNYATRFDGFNTYIKVLKIIKDGNTEEIELDLLDYLCEKVLSSEHWDYNLKSFKKYSPNDKIKYRFKGNYYSMPAGDVKSDTFKYVEVSPDERLGRSTRAIPNVNYSDSVRISMGARMNNQSITITTAEQPLVSTGHKDYEKSSLIVRAGCSGTVVAVDNDVVIKRIDDGKLIKIPIPENMTAQYSINVSFTPTVKVGDKVDPDSIVVKPLGISDNGDPLLGVNAFTVFGHYYGYTYEDGAVISESFSNKLTHIYILDFDVKIKDTDKLEGITPIGTKLVSKDVIIKLIRRKSASKQVRELTDIFFPEENQEMDFDSSIYCPNNIFESYLVDATYCTGAQMNDYALNQVKLYMNDKPDKVNLPFDYHYNKLVKPSNEPDELYAVKVIFRLVVRAKAVVGDKVTNRYGSKGVITKILPDKEMWRTESGKAVDIIMNPMAVMSRKNIPQTMEVGLTQICEAAYAAVMKNIDNVSKVRGILKLALFDDYLNLSDDELINKIKTDKKLIYTVGCYGRIPPKDIIRLLEHFNLDDGKMTILKPDGKPFRQKMVCGYQYIEKLLFLASFSNKVTSDDFENEAMVLGLGAEKTGGQSLEEMIFWSLQSHGATDAINRFRDSAGRKSEYWLKAHILTAGLDLVEKKS